MTSLAYRSADANDLPFIVESFLDSYRTSRAAGLISMDTWEEVMRPQWQRILQRPGVEAFVAFHPGEEGHRADVYGWLAVERGYDLVLNEYAYGKHQRRKVRTDVPLILYVYVKQPYRRMGIARGLFKAAAVDPQGRWNYATRTAIVSKLAGKFPRAEWEALVVRFPKSEVQAQKERE